MFKAKVLIKRRKTILDPQGKAVEIGAKHLGLGNIRNTRIDKYIEFNIDTHNRKDAEDEVQKLTDEHTKLIDDILKHKETEIMEV